MVKLKTAVFGGGCFWCTEAVFGMLRGVTSVMPGYAGGTTKNPTYEAVSSGKTGHVEVTKVEFDPDKISYRDLLTIFFASHDPTTRNRQGNDIGTQYRSVIFYTTNKQKIAAEMFIRELDDDPARPIVTQIAPLDTFYPAEDYHQKYYEKHKDQPYCEIVISPKIEKLKEKYSELLKESEAEVGHHEPHPFFWGSATSAHQVEGGNRNDWAEWEKKNAKLLVASAQNKKWPDYILENYPNPLQEKNYISGRAVDHYNRFQEDFDIARELSHNAHRLSIEWSRIEPEEGKFDDKEIEHYWKVIRALREREIEPFITLWHWTLPVWLEKKGGIESKEFPSYFKRYAIKIGEALKADARFWITLNEPEIFSLNSFYRGIWPPQKKSIILFYRSIAHLIKAHRLAYQAMHEIAPKAKIGASLNMSYFESGGGLINNILVALAKKAWNLHFVTHIKRDLDFIGLNYYFHNRINYGFNKNRNVKTSDMGWEIFPEGIYEVLKDLKQYNLPIYITENGLADARDAQRAECIEEHIVWIKKAMAEGINVRGYFHWSLLDNFEWDKGFWPRFGLIEVDYRTMERKIRPSALAYKKIIEHS